jgi:citrate synthase
MSKTAILELDGKKYEFPVIVGSENEVAIDINKLRDLSGAITMDPGYKNSGSCKSDITFLDGEEGILRYRGYSIEDLADKANFLKWLTSLFLANCQPPSNWSSLKTTSANTP